MACVRADVHYYGRLADYAWAAWVHATREGERQLGGMVFRKVQLARWVGCVGGGGQ